MRSRNRVRRSVLVVEDDGLLRELLAVALEGHDFVVETAASAADAKRMFGRGDFDAVLLDVSLGPGPNGFDLAEVLRAQQPHLAIVFLTNVPDPRFAGRAASDLPKSIAYLRKSSLGDIDSIVRALDASLRGARLEGFREDRDPDRPLAELTPKQLAVVSLAAQGLSNSQIASRRGVTVKAIEDTLGRAAIALGIDIDEQPNVRVSVVRRYLSATKGDVPTSKS